MSTWNSHDDILLTCLELNLVSLLLLLGLQSTTWGSSSGCCASACGLVAGLVGSSSADRGNQGATGYRNPLLGFEVLLDKFSNQVEFEIECSKVHHTSVQRGRSVQEGEGSECSGDEEEDERELNEDILRETLYELGRYPLWWRRVLEDEGELYEIGKGGEATIYAGIWKGRVEDLEGRYVVFKVFPRGFYLQDFVKHWPESSSWYGSAYGLTWVDHVMLMPNDVGGLQW